MTSAELFFHVEAIWKRCEDYAQRDPAVWIYRLSLDELRAHAARLAALDPATLPLYGVPFAIKDNIDLAGVPTTAGCPAFAYTPTASAFVVERLIAAGAIPVGKTNLDQFATGLVGTRSPHGAPRNVFNSDYISGGSSSGSSVAVAAGLVDFALGTDTAGSGRVPAAFNGLVGVKPTRGALSNTGLVPACRSLDCISIFARNTTDAARFLSVAQGYDSNDAFARQSPLASAVPFPAPSPSPVAAHAPTLSQSPVPRPIPARPRIGIPTTQQLEWFGNTESPALFAAALERLRATGAEIVEVDFAPFLDAARLLYEGPWTAERYAAAGEFIEKHSTTPEAARAAGIDPTVAKIILGGKTASAADAFRATYRLAELRRAADTVLATVDLLVAPTTGTTYTVAELEADPIRLNSNLGRYNNFMNLLDLCGLTLPAGRYSFGPGFGITLIGSAWQDNALLALGARYLGEPAPAFTSSTAASSIFLSAPAAPAEIILAVCGAHLRGHPLHHQLTALNARFVAATTTSAHYKLYALANTTPPKPGLARTIASSTSSASPEDAGAPIAVETYALTPEAFGRFTAAIPAPLAIGNAELKDGTWVKSFICEPHALHGATEITSYGGWANWLAR